MSDQICRENNARCQLACRPFQCALNAARTHTALPPAVTFPPGAKFQPTAQTVTLWDHYAAAALSATILHPNIVGTDEEFACAAANIADAMLAERAKRIK